LGNWNHEIAADDRDTARSRTGFVIKYAGAPITWASRLQTEIALSSTESKYKALSTSLREAISMIDFLQELLEAGFKLNTENQNYLMKSF
jgi:hypothetical protein